MRAGGRRCKYTRSMHCTALAGEAAAAFGGAPLGPRVVARVARLEHVGAADHLVDCAEAHGGHVLAQLLGDQEEKVDHLLRRPRKLGAQLRVLRRPRATPGRQRSAGLGA